MEDRGNRLRRDAGDGIGCRYTGSGLEYEVRAEVVRFSTAFGKDVFVVDFVLRA